jgi:ElaB/YqjD/DUF883 family membrane-anchored ribosome-binding protein
MSKGNNGDGAGFAEGASGGDGESAAAALQEELMNGFAEAESYLKRQLAERPLVVAAAALGVGVILGLLLGKRR